MESSGSGQSSKQTFKDVQFYVTGITKPEILHHLEAGGALKRKFLVDKITHVICGDEFDENEAAEASDLYDLPLVSQEWVLASVSLGRLANTKAYDPIVSSKVFHNQTFAVSGLSTMDFKTLYAFITFNGGKVEKKYSQHCTHLICGSAEDSVYNSVKNNPNIVMVTPDWVLDCIKASKVIESDPYHPRLLKASNQTSLTIDKVEKNEMKDTPGHNSVTVQISRPQTVQTGQTLRYQQVRPQVSANNQAQIQQIMTSTGQGITNSGPEVKQEISSEGQPKVLIQELPTTSTVSQPAAQVVKMEVPSNLGNPTPSTVQSIQRIATVPTISTMARVNNNTGQPQIHLINNNQGLTKQGTMVVQGSNVHQIQMPSNQPQQQQQQLPPQGYQNIQMNSVQIKAHPQQPINPQQQNVPLSPIIQQTQMHKQVILGQLQQQHGQSTGTGNQTQSGPQNIVIINQNQIHQGTQQQNPSTIIIQQHQQPQSVQQTIQQKVATMVRQPDGIITPQGRVIQKPGLMGQQPIQAQINKLNVGGHQLTTAAGAGQMVMNQGQQQKIVLQTQCAGQPGELPSQVPQMQQQQQPQVMAQQQLIVHHQTGMQEQMVNSQQQQQQQQGPVQPGQNINIIQQQQQQANQQSGPWNPTIKMGPNQQLIPGQFIRTGQRQLIHLDAQTHAQLQSMDPIKKAEYLAKLQNKQRNIMFRQQVFPGRPGGPTSIVTAPRIGGPQQHIVIRGQMPTGLTSQQQVQWIQQQRPQVLVRSNSTPISQVSGIGNIPQQATPPFPGDGNVGRPPIQRIASIPGGTKILQQQSAPGQTIQTRFVAIDRSTIGPDGNPILTTNQMQIAGDNSASSPLISKTKTALANMLNSRLNNINTLPDGTVEPSAAGTLRLMTAQHNAALNQSVNVRSPQELIALQHRRPMATGGAPQIKIEPPITGSGPMVGGVTGNSQVPFSSVRVPIQKPQFYGHNPNLRLPPELFLICCNFFIVEYDETHKNELPQWKSLIQKHGGVIETFYCPRVTHVLCRSQRHGVVMQAIRDGKRCVTAYWLNDVILKKQVTPPWEALHLPAPSTFGVQKPAARHIIAISGFESEERQRIKKMVEDSGAKLTSYFSKQNTVLICKRLDGAKYKKAKEWNIPVLNATWLSDILLGNLSTMTNYDTTKYQQYNLNCPFRIEYSLVPHLMTAWKSPINLTQEAHERVKRAHSEPISDQKPKRIRTLPPLERVPEDISVKSLPPEGLAPRIAFSQVDNIEGLTKAIIALGGSVVTEEENATHLVMTRLVRTCKLLTCLCTANHVLSSRWITESANVGQFLPENIFQIRSTEFDELFKCDIPKTLNSPIRRKLFTEKIFYITPSVRPSIKELTKLIELMGGVVEKIRRSAVKIQEANTQNPDSYIILTCPNDLHLLNDLTRSNKVNRLINKTIVLQICTTELVMKSIMNQSIDFEGHAIKYI